MASAESQDEDDDDVKPEAFAEPGYVLRFCLFVFGSSVFEKQNAYICQISLAERLRAARVTI
jgi:hypothetical protein